jgi:thiamine-monophosphate kinase
MPSSPSNTHGKGDRIADETDLIQTYLAPLTKGAPGAFGLRDDAALLTPDPGTDLVVTSDPIICGVHFFPTDAPADLAWKALAVNASDIAAKGAEPLGYMLTLAFPEPPEREWVHAFSEGLRSAQKSFGCRLIGGDTDLTPGPLTIGVTLIGTVPRGKFVTRQGAAKADHVFVTGTIGDSAIGLAIHRELPSLARLCVEDRAFLLGRYLRPQPRLRLAETLRAHASAALDISDGLIKDLSRLAGSLGFTLEFPRLPLSQATARALALEPALSHAILSGGDDYELLVAVPPAAIVGFRQGAEAAGIPVTDLGPLEQAGPLRILDEGGAPLEVQRPGYDHFSA